MPAMKQKGSRLLAKMLVILLLSLTSMVNIPQATAERGNLETYIVFVKKPPFSFVENLDSWYRSFLPVTTSGSDEQRLVHSYRSVVTGFAARLTAEEAKTMEKKEGFLSARPARSLPLHTTHTPSFLGLQEGSGLWNVSNYGKGVIIGLVDTGIAPNHPSFNDEGMPPPPKKWKGRCEFNGTTCNNKLIGARNFLSKGGPPLDEVGHGTHTSSTSAGSPVQGASFYGEYNGKASGIAPLAYVAMYKACSTSCEESDILAAMDAAVEDGVDVLSLSLGGPSRAFFNDSIAIGAYRAIQKGIFVSCSAGNSGPDNHSLSNEAPWILTVGASTVDREIRATVLLGNKKLIAGQSLLQPKNFPPMPLPLFNPGANSFSGLCLPGSLKNFDVKGKIVLCRGGGVDATDIAKGQEVKDNGGAAMILVNDIHLGYVTSALAHVLPASDVTYEAGQAIQAYINSTSSPEASLIFGRTVYGLPEAPQVASFSSRGPSLASPGISKPDVVGPGVNILAAWPNSVDNSTNSPAPFNVISGTSMSCPHLSGIAALLKSTHPEWSPAAIKSAIMTTADVLNLGGKPISDQQYVQQFVPASAFVMGAGHVNASKVDDPGLIYDIQPDDYIPYLCGLNYSDEKVGIIVQRTVKCSNYNSIPEAQLNYPSFSIILGANPQTYTRTVTNVGEPNSSYSLKIIAPQGVDVLVTPNVLNFTEVNQKAKYSVTFSKNGNMTGGFAQGYLIWKFKSRIVRSPIAVIY